MIVAGLLILALTAPFGCDEFDIFNKDKDDDDKEKPEITIRPQENSELWGFQVFQLGYDMSENIQVSSISYSNGQSEIPVLNDTTLLRSKIGYLEFTFCTNCVTGNNITLHIQFKGDNPPDPMSVPYRINHQPVIVLNSQTLPGEQLMLCARESFDPEGQSLTYSWSHFDQTWDTSVITVERNSLMESPVALRITDGIAITDDLVCYDPEVGGPSLVRLNIKCTDLAIVTSGKGLLNNIDLGPTISAGEYLPVDANKKITKNFSIGFGFEVLTSITPGTEYMDEGQDVARTFSMQANDTTGLYIKTGRKRKTTNRSEYENIDSYAGFPVPLPPSGTHPFMVEDNYDHHPTIGYLPVNNSSGVNYDLVLTKGYVYRTGETPKLIWFDEPGFTIQRGADVSKGRYYKAYFRSWMMPDIPPCEKYFIVEIEINEEGMVTKNELTMR